MNPRNSAVFIGILFLAAIVPGTVWCQMVHKAQPGSISYVEGQAAIGQRALTAASIGSIAVGRGETLTTGEGRAEILLTPGAVLRLDRNSAVKLVAAEAPNVEVELVKGQAMVETRQVPPKSHLWVDQGGARASLLKAGLYEFDADHSQVRVFSGDAELAAGNQKIKLGDNRMAVIAAGGPLQSQGFDNAQYEEDDFYRWSSLRSGLLPEARDIQERLFGG